jgi:hypothetical protein
VGLVFVGGGVGRGGQVGLDELLSVLYQTGCILQMPGGLSA